MAFTAILFISTCNNFESIYLIFLQLDLISLAHPNEQFCMPNMGNKIVIIFQDMIQPSSYF